MKIRKADRSDLKNLLPVYTHARKTMRENGNPHQWGDDRPSRAALINDIQNGCLYLLEQDGEIVGAFALVLGEDPTYRHIEGSWKNTLPYGTIHRLASSGKGHGVFKACLSFCKERIDNLRIDTHADNHIMRRLLEENGFSRCGIIYIEDGSPRIAYQYTAIGPQAAE